MLNDILDYGTDHSAIFSTVLIFVIVTFAAIALWAYSRCHERAVRRRASDLTG